eukprot:830966-Prymnesium_polylepis.1
MWNGVACAWRRCAQQRALKPRGWACEVRHGAPRDEQTGGQDLAPLVLRKYRMRTGPGLGAREAVSRLAGVCVDASAARRVRGGAACRC